MHCARCGRWIFRHSPVNANYCPKDEVYLCRRCTRALRTPRTCPECGTRTSSSHAGVFVAGSVLSILFVIFGAVFTGMFLWDAHFQNAPATPIQQASPGQTIKITGTIGGSPGTVVADGIFIHAYRSSHWDWTFYNFLLIVGNLTVNVNAGGIGQSIYDSPHDLTSDHEQYWVGDRVAVVGVVDSVTQLSANAVAPGPNRFVQGWEEPVAVGADCIFGVAVATSVVVHYISTGRFRRHTARTSSGTPFGYVPGAPPPDGL
ncbi:MAG: hypothetical protein L3K19_04050 [Thermoplasmata archaeon]|nr:hypothetical protein [Thermoplasmata archaeon]